MTKEVDNDLCARCRKSLQDFSEREGQSLRQTLLRHFPEVTSENIGKAYSNLDAKTPSAAFCARVADVTGVDLRWLITGEPSAPESVQEGESAYRRGPPEVAVELPGGVKPGEPFVIRVVWPERRGRGRPRKEAP